MEITNLIDYGDYEFNLRDWKEKDLLLFARRIKTNRCPVRVENLKVGSHYCVGIIHGDKFLWDLKGNPVNTINAHDTTPENDFYLRLCIKTKSARHNNYEQIVAWADGYKIQKKRRTHEFDEWEDYRFGSDDSLFGDNECMYEFRVKPGQGYYEKKVEE